MTETYRITAARSGTRGLILGLIPVPGGAARLIKLSLRPLLLIAVLISLSACIATQPRDISNVCTMFEERRSWYKAAERTEERWGVPVHVSMAFIHQESAYQARIRPARNRLLWVIPWTRPSSAFGYAQALDTTWSEYRQATGNRLAMRSNFGDAMDFIGWYNRNSHRRNNIPYSDARNLYLAYHEGNTGFARGSYAGNATLLATAQRVQANADRYQAQFAQCERELGKNWFMRVFS
jgi:hypothetical protein